MCRIIANLKNLKANMLNFSKFKKFKGKYFEILQIFQIVWQMHKDLHVFVSSNSRDVEKEASISTKSFPAHLMAIKMNPMCLFQ